MSEKLQIVTIDGPSGVGKSTVSRRLAVRLGFTYLDTGAMYRAVAFACHERAVAPTDPPAVTRVLDGMRLELLPALEEEEETRVVLNGREVGNQLRTPEISMLASAVSALFPVREKLTALQQSMGKAGRLVAEGRDTGTVVFPGAAWKFFLDASPEERCRRRVRQLEQRGEVVDPVRTLTQIIERDKNDRERSVAPLRAAKDAVVVDASSLTVDQVLERMMRVIRPSMEQPV